MDADCTHWVLRCEGNYDDPEFGLIQGTIPMGKSPPSWASVLQAEMKSDLDGNFQK